jgi:hypothetical protein
MDVRSVVYDSPPKNIKQEKIGLLLIETCDKLILTCIERWKEYVAIRCSSSGLGLLRGVVCPFLAKYHRKTTERE